jgi:hypothetical protein
MANKLVELVEDARLESLEDHAICSLCLPICVRVSERYPIDLDSVPVSEIQELLAREVGAVVGDDGVGHTKLEDDIKKKLDSLLGAKLDDWFCFNPFGELAHHDE